MHGDALQQAYAHKSGQQSAAAVREEWQGNARYRQQANNHSHVYERLQEDECRNTYGDVLTEVVARACRDQRSAYEQHYKETEHERAADKAKFFRQYGEHEVFVLHAQVL